MLLAKKIAGGIGGDVHTNVNVLNCYSQGEVVGTGNNVGDILGYTDGQIINCYTKRDTFTATDLGDAFVDNPENSNQPLLHWELEDGSYLE